MSGDAPPPPPPRTGLSLYANLLDKDTPGTISSAPVTYKSTDNGFEQDEAAKKQQAIAGNNLNPSLRFQPTKRPQLAAQKAKAKAIASKLAGITPNEPKPPIENLAQQTTTSIAQPNPTKSSAADWTATLSEDEDIHAYATTSRQRGRKKRKKNKDEQVQIEQDWDDIYDPSRPNNYEEYKHSEEKIREVREWKDLLYRHRMQRKSDSYDSDQSEEKSTKQRFHPPPMSFAPPSNLNEEPSTSLKVPEDDDPYLRRMHMTQVNVPTTLPTPPPPTEGQISRAPVRYNLPPPPPELPIPEEDETMTEELEANESQPRSNRPGQKGFAERLLTKYGWTKGQGLGAQGTGIINPLYAKADKRKKKSDAEGGGFATPANTGRILGGDKSKSTVQQEESKFGEMSEVIRLEGMLDGMDVASELQRTDEEGGGGLMQEIGQECGEKYGSVERVFVHVPDDDDGNDGENVSGATLVFVQFVSQLSALRAVNALNGRIFNGNTIRAKYWDRGSFERGEYF